MWTCHSLSWTEDRAQWKGSAGRKGWECVVKAACFRREKQDGWAEERKERVKDSEGIFSLRPPSFPPFSSPHVKDKPGGAAVWPSDCVWRLVVPHTGTPLITGAGLSLLDTKTPHADSTEYTHMQTCKHNKCYICLCTEGETGGGERSKFLSVFTEVHVIISKMFWQWVLRKECQILWSHTKRAVLNWFSI